MGITNEIRNKVKGVLAAILILCMSGTDLSAVYAATQQATAVSVRVLQSDGIVELRNSNGRTLPVVEGMRLYHGYQVTTQESSYAYMALDENRLATLGAVSDMELERKDNDLALMLNSGKLFFDVSSKMGEEETMNIHTSNVALGIRGTAGLVEIINAKHTRVWLFDGQIYGVVTNQINEQKKEILMMPGMVADFYVYDMNHGGDKCDIIVRNYHESEVCGFVLREMKKNLETVERIRQSGGGDFYPYLGQAEEKLQADEAQMHEHLEKIRQAQEDQLHLIGRIPLFPAENDADTDSSGGVSENSGMTPPADLETPEETEGPDDSGDSDDSEDSDDSGDSDDSEDSDDSDDSVVHENATLLSGSQLNQKFQELLDYADTHGLTWNPFYIKTYAAISDLKAIRYADAAPPSDAYTVTLETSGSPVYAWYQSGTIYLYSDAPKIQLAADSSGMLKGFYSLTDISGLEKLDMANVTNLSEAFSSARSLTDFSPVSGWDVSGVTDLSYAFSGCTSMTDLSDLSSWNTGQVTDLSYAFAYNTALTSVEGIADWNTSSVTVLDSIFSGCTGLNDASSLSAHSAGSYMAWDVKRTFQNAVTAEQFVNTGVAADTSYSGYPDWFMKTYSFIGEDGNTEIYQAAIPMDAMDLNTVLQNQLAEKAPEYLKNWNTSEDGSGTVLGDSENTVLITEDMSFYYQPKEATLVTGSNLKKAIKNVAFAADDVLAIKWSDTPPGDNVTDKITISEAGSDDTVVCWYEGVSGGGTVYLYGDVKNVYLNPNSSGAFASFEYLQDISGLARLDCSKVTNLSSAFYHDYRLLDLMPIANWDTSQVEFLDYTFCNMGQSINGLDNLNALKDWDTSNVTSMNLTFADHVLKDISGLENWNTQNVTSFLATFSTSGSQGNTFDNVDALQNWKTGSATNMLNMFQGCDSLRNVNGLLEWDVSKVTNMSGIFMTCKNLEDITGLQNWDTSAVQNMTRAFSSCEKLTNLNGISNWKFSSAVSMEQMFFGSTALTDASSLERWELSGEINVSDMFETTVVKVPFWYQNGVVVMDSPSALTLDAGAGTVELDDIAPASTVTFYSEPQQISRANPDPEILGEEYIADAVELPAAEHETAIFESWNTRTDGSGTSYEAGEIFALEGQTTLYAIWSEPDAAGGANYATPSNATPSNATPSNAVPSGVDSSNAASPKATPSDAASPGAASSNATPSNAVPSGAASSDAAPVKATPSDARYKERKVSVDAVPGVPRSAFPMTEKTNLSLADIYLESWNKRKRFLFL